MGSNDTNGINAFHTSESQNLGCKKRKKVKIMMIHDILLYKEGISSNNSIIISIQMKVKLML